LSFRVVLDLDTCQGYANCVMVAPEVFDIDEQTGKAVLLREHPDHSQLAAAEEAVRQCPSEALSIES
jgi:ferredoxin